MFWVILGVLVLILWLLVAMVNGAEERKHPQYWTETEKERRRRRGY